MGLLGTSWEDPRTTGILQAAQALMSARRPMEGIAQGLLGYQGALQQAKQAKAAEEERALRRQMAELQFQQAQQAQTKAQAIEAAYRDAIRTPQQMAMAAHGGPTVAAAQAAPGTAPGIDQNSLIRGLMQADPQSAFQMIQPKPADYKVVGDALLQVGPGGVKEAYRAPTKPDLNSLIVMGPDGQPMVNRQLLDAKREIARAGASNTQVSYGSPMAGVDAQGRPVFFQPSKDGGAPAIVPGVRPPKSDKPLTESQAKAAAFASQMMAGEQAFLAAGTDGGKLGDQVQTRIAQGAGNFVVSPEAQKARQAQEQWAEAYLRFKTGAAATEAEVVRNVRTFFPQPGDKPEVVKQKEQMRAQAAHDVKIAAGGAPIESVYKPQGKQVVRTGTSNGRRVVQYSDGSIEYAD